MIPVLVKTVQELHGELVARIDQLNAKNEALEARIAALEAKSGG